MKLIKINGAEFELHKSNMHNVAPITGCNVDEIYEVYNRPSFRKVGIWEDWCRWCKQINEDDTDEQCGIEIASWNHNFFTIRGSYRTGDKVYDLFITAHHWRAYEHR